MLPIVQNIARNIIEDNLNKTGRISELQRHETLSIIEEFHVTLTTILYVTPPCFGTSSAREELDWTVLFYIN